MGISRWIASLFVAGLILTPGGPAVAQTPEPQLFPFPAEMHPNDPFYLAGHGFPANQPLQVYLFCNSLWHSYYGHWMWTASKKRMQTGNFTGWELHAPTPFSRSPQTCQLTASDGNNPAGVTAEITISPRDKQIDAVHLPISLHLHVGSKRRRMELADASSEPGTHLLFHIKYPGTKPAVQRVTLPWTGRIRLHWRVPAGVTRGAHVPVSVSGRLGVFHTQPKRRMFLALR